MANEDNSDNSQKTEPPTPRRLERARREGQVPISRELRSWLLLASACAVLVFAAGPLSRFFLRISTGFIEKTHEFSAAPATVLRIVRDLVLDVGILLALPFGVFLFIVVAANIVQVGPLWASKKLRIYGSSINPITGLKQKLSSNNLVEFLKSLFKIALVFIVGFWAIFPSLELVADLPNWDTALLMPLVQEKLGMVLLAVLMAYLVLVLLDVAWQRYITYERLKMTRREVMDERRQTEGSPEVRQRIARLRRERGRAVLSQAMRQADVVITNPTHYAVALAYKPAEHEAPVVVAKGLDFLAQRIRELALDLGIPIVEDPPLARVLYANTRLDEPIPPDYYQAVAEIISYIWNSRGAPGAGPGGATGEPPGGEAP